MPKSSGLGDRLFVDGYDISGDVSAVDTIAAPSGQYEVPGIDKSAQERIYGLYDGEMAFSHYFNKETGESFQQLKAKNSGNDRVACWFRGLALGNKGAGLVSKQNTFNWSRGNDGSLTGSSQLMGQGFGLEYGEQLTPGKRTDSAATNGASLDNSASTALGLAAYLQVFAFTGTDATLKLQESSDDGATDAFADVTGGAFAQVTAANVAERIVTSLTQTVERYLRVVTTTSAGFTNLEFAVLGTRYPYAD